MKAAVAILILILLLAAPGLADQKDKTGIHKWAPADIDEAVPHTETTHPCPLPALLEGAGRQARKLVENLQQFSARETLEYAEIAANGLPQSTHTTEFTYVADIREVRPGQFMVEEYRNDAAGTQSFPSRLATTGTAAFALIFHSYYLRDFEMTCEGSTQVDGHPAWQLHFTQRSDRSNNFRGYRVANLYYPVQLKGRAWISQDSHEVLRLETDLLHTVPAIKLQREHVIIEYGPVRFARHDVSLWLPQSATIHMDYRGKRYFHKHTFAGYKLFWVETKDAAKLPAER